MKTNRLYFFSAPEDIPDIKIPFKENLISVFPGTRNDVLAIQYGLI